MNADSIAVTMRENATDVRSRDFFLISDPCSSVFICGECESMDASQEPVVASRVIQLVRDRTPARVLVGRVGPAYRTVTQLELRQDHAAAVDAVHAELEIDQAFGHGFVAERGLFEV